MGLTDYTRKLLDLSRTVHRWLGALVDLDAARRERVAGYAEDIAATLRRAADALARLDASPRNAAAAREVAREFGRISGYVETIVDALQHHLDGRKLSGVKRRLEQLAVPDPGRAAAIAADAAMIGRLVAAEGYFRALADGLRT